MAFGWVQKNTSPIGVDFGSDSLKLMQIVLDDPPRLVAAACVDIPDDMRRDATAHGRFVSQALRNLLREGRFKGRRIITSISAAQAYTQHVRLPKIDGTLIEQQIEGALRGRLPIDPSGMVIRHVPIGEVFSEGSAKQEVICFAAPRESVMRTVEATKAAGLEVVGMHCEPMAVLQAFDHLFRDKEARQRTTMFLDLGASTTKVLIAHGDTLAFAKTVHVGGEHFAQQLAETEGIALAAARVKWTRKAEPVAAGAGEARRTGRSLAALDTLAPPVAEPVDEADDDGGEMLEVLGDELHLCIGYHQSMFPQRPIDKVIFLGGESRQTALCKRLAQALRLPAQLGNPLARLANGGLDGRAVGLDLRERQGGWAVPLGLCMLPTNL